MKNISPIQDIGRRSPRFDAPDKTRGKELFASDLSPENLLWAGVRRAGIAHGQLRSTLTDRAPKAHALNTGNILKAATIIKGDPSAISTCDILLEERFSTPVQEHAYIETENGVARLDGATVQCLLALAALNTKGRPVKMWWDREESMVAGYKRHAARMHYCLGAKKDGELVALKCEIDYDTGAYAHLGVEIMALGLEHAAGPYRIPNMEAKGRCIYTNNPIAGAFRGFGVAQVSFAFEGMMDRLALKLNMDPLAPRRKNALIRGDKNCSDITMTHSTGMAECLSRLSDHDLWTERKKWIEQAPQFKRRGVGISAVFNGMGYGHGLPDSAVAKVRLTQSGTIRVYNGVSDMGQGNGATFVHMAGEILCQGQKTMELVQPDTDRTHPSGSSSAGRTTYTCGNALIKACTALRDKRYNRAALMLLTDAAQGFAMVTGARWRAIWCCAWQPCSIPSGST